MASVSTIEWTQRTWNPVRGCTRLSEGCRNCYAERVAARFCGPGLAYEGIAEMRDGKPRWTGKLAFVEGALLEPLKRRKPTTYFVNSMSDLFHEKMPDAWIDRVFAVMALCPQHIFQVLTKRPSRMRVYLSAERRHAVSGSACAIADGSPSIFPSRASIHATGIIVGRVVDPLGSRWPLPNVWLGASCEDQATADARVPELLATPAAIRFVSAEPLLGPIDFTRIACPNGCQPPGYCIRCSPDGGRATGTFDALAGGDLHQIIVGGESGPKARPMHSANAQSICDQCTDAGTVAFFLKQWGEWNSEGVRVGKARAGRLLGGIEHNGMPRVGHG